MAQAPDCNGTTARDTADDDDTGNTNIMKLLKWTVFVLLPLALIVAPVAIAFAILEDTPATTKRQTVSAADVSRTRSIGRQAVEKLLNAKEQSSLTFSQKDVDGMIALATRTSTRLSGKVDLHRSGLNTAITLKLPRNPIGRYVNLEFGLNPSSTGLDISHVELGRISITGATAVAVIRVGLNFILGDDEGAKLLQAIRSTRFKGKSVILAFNPLPDLKGRIKKVSQRLGDARDSVALLGDPDTIQIYYAKIVEVDSMLAGQRNVSLSRFMGPLFQLAKNRSGFSDPVTENQAAILAMTIYFGDSRFERLTGKVRKGALKFHKAKTRNIKLGGRGDLLLHFIISAGLEIVANTGVSAAIGEFKELLDSDGGSGFSFVDLAADTAGIRFAETATGDEKGALRLQRLIAESPAETLFFPSTAGLVEGLSKGVFKKKFGDVDSDSYKLVVRDIEQRIASRPVFQ